MTKSEPWERLFLRCEAGSDQFFVCEIYGTHAKMINAIALADDKQREPNTRAACLSYVCSLDGEVTPELGTLFFHKTYITPAALAHEFTHAALVWCRRNRINPMVNTKTYRRRDAEERMAHAVGYMMYQFYQKQRERVFFIGGGKLTYRDVCRVYEK